MGVDRTDYRQRLTAATTAVPFIFWGHAAIVVLFALAIVGMAFVAAFEAEAL